MCELYRVATSHRWGARVSRSSCPELLLKTGQGKVHSGSSWQNFASCIVCSDKIVWARCVFVDTPELMVQLSAFCEWNERYHYHYSDPDARNHWGRKQKPDLILVKRIYAFSGPSCLKTILDLVQSSVLIQGLLYSTVALWKTFFLMCLFLVRRLYKAIFPFCIKLLIFFRQIIFVRIHSLLRYTGYNAKLNASALDSAHILLLSSIKPGLNKNIRF